MLYDYRIYQTPVGTSYCFRPYIDAVINGLKREDYVSVFANTVKANTIGEALDIVWEIHNSEMRPSRDCFRSLSISDIVTINGTPYYCDVVGWSEIPTKNWRR